MAQERSIEVKVGILILVSLGILAAFVLVMGGLNFQKTYSVSVDFDNPGGLQYDAPVRIASVKSGFGEGPVVPRRQGRSEDRSADARAKCDVVDRRASVRRRHPRRRRVLRHHPGGAWASSSWPSSLGPSSARSLPDGTDRNKVVDPAPSRSLSGEGLRPARHDGHRDPEQQAKLISDIAVTTGGLLKGDERGPCRTTGRASIGSCRTSKRSAPSRTISFYDAKKQYVDTPKIQRTIDNVQDRLTGDEAAWPADSGRS